MKIAIYLSAVPKTKNELKVAALKRFGVGASLNGDSVNYVTDYETVDSDVSVIQGFISKDIISPHLKLRNEVLKKSSKTIIIDSNLFQFASRNNPNYYLRYSLNGIFPSTGFYFDNDIDPARWSKISKNLNLSLKEYRQTGDHILICLQRVDGWSMTGVGVQQWLDSTIKTIQENTDRSIIVRKHPGDKQQQLLKINFKNVSFSDNPLLENDLQDCWASVTFNSSPSVASLINGIPTFVTDPNPCNSQSYPLCNTDITKIENPKLNDRQEWIEKISQSHWNENEVESGEAWAFMKHRLEKLKSSLS